jgi:hypothetical protein
MKCQAEEQGVHSSGVEKLLDHERGKWGRAKDTVVQFSRQTLLFQLDLVCFARPGGHRLHYDLHRSHNGCWQLQKAVFPGA